MNRVILIGRLTKDPVVTYQKSGDGGNAVARYTLAVSRRFKNKNGEYDADFINCVVFGKGAEFSERYFHKGQQIAIEGRIQTGSYTNKEGQKVYTTDVVIESQEFAESKKEGSNNSSGGKNNSGKGEESVMDGFMEIPQGVEDSLPFA